MVAKITSGKSIRGILHYNESKVSGGVAQLIMASGFAGEIDRMGFEEKLARFSRLIELNGKVKTNAIHISLNFHPDEKLSEKKLQGIATEYMKRIGFDEQPFLVYRHIDSAHPHVHIATTNIRRNGSRIDINKIGFRLSEPARKALELEFGLIRAEGKAPVVREPVRPVLYGHRPTRQVIGNLVTRVVQEYAFSSFNDFRTVLEHFGVIADGGEKGSRMHERKGLQFFLTGRDAKAMGLPVKASEIHSKPTMVNLESRFEKNRLKKVALKSAVKGKLNLVLASRPLVSREGFVQALKAQQVETVFRRSAEGKLYGLTFIDLEHRAVFNGSELGKEYSARMIGERFVELGVKDVALEKKGPNVEKDLPFNPVQEHSGEWSARPLSMLELLTLREFSGGTHLPGKKKKRRKKGQVQDLSR